MKLVSMTDFVFSCRENKKLDNIRRFWACERYAKFLKQPLTLGMFIPCDEEGNVLEEPEPYEVRIGFDKSDIEWNKEEVEEYIKAQEKVLFKGFESKELPERISFFKEGRCIITYSFTKDDFLGNSPTIERVSGFNLNLTYNAIKQFGL